MIELEREFTFLINRLPDDLATFPSKIIEDNYIPVSSDHPKIRIRRNGDKLVITKKYPANSTNEQDGDSSRMVEHTIELNAEEYDALNQLPGKKFKKRRFAYKHGDYSAEVDVYLENLAGLVVIDFEFDSEAAMTKFQKPDFAGADVTQDVLLAGSTLCGKSYDDIADTLLEKYGYQPVAGVEVFNE